MQSEQLIQSLIEQTRQIINQAERIQEYELPYLNWRASSDSWSMLECLEHLNLYGDFYYPEIRRLMDSSNTVSEATYKTGILGDYFAKSMLPKEKLNKMKTFKDKNPLNSKLDKATIDRFIRQQHDLLDLLDRSKNVSLNKIKIGISIAKWIKLNLGDTFRFLINHNIRHMKQIDRVQRNFAEINGSLEHQSISSQIIPVR